mmetsp:Transcript_103738/g.302781  ORF Transcript_103738/g.302781 Transcript_103738/m.302781 type:complete len:439 (+) Transcript_103738:1-1317(+)
MYGPAEAARARQALHFEAPAGCLPGGDPQQRRATLWDWGRRRERKMHRKPACLMDQMVSGSGYYPPRLLENTWFSSAELAMIQRLQQILQGTGHAVELAHDMLTPMIFDVDVRIVLDNSGSMQLDMFGNQSSTVFNRELRPNEHAPAEYSVQQALAQSIKPGWFSSNGINCRLPSDGPSPFRQRWWFARDVLRKWRDVYQTLGMDPWVYLLNRHCQLGFKCRASESEYIFSSGPGGSTAMTEALERALADHHSERPRSPMLLLVVTDGEANNMITFNNLLDDIQNRVHGDVQVCLLGLSLVKADIEWFENEECDETRIRTVEPYEVEHQQIQLKEVVKKESGYNFAMHCYRVLLTNFFPADYDYEAPIQNLRHRLYITLHGRDRWYSRQCPLWKLLVTQAACPLCFLATGGHCCGWCQGVECGKWQLPESLEPCCGEE